MRTILIAGSHESSWFERNHRTIYTSRVKPKGTYHMTYSELQHRRHGSSHHARVLKGVAKSQFPRKAVVFKSGDRILLRF